MNDTDDEEHLHGDVAANCAVAHELMMVAGVGVTDEADVVGHGHGHVESGQQDQPVPHGLEDAVVQQDEAGLPHRRHLVLGQGRFLEDALKDRDSVDDISLKGWMDAECLFIIF